MTEDRNAIAITRMRTVNTGNQALSAEFLRVCRAVFDGNVTPLERDPAYLARFGIDQLRSAGADCFGVFEKWAEQLAKQAHGFPSVDPSPLRSQGVQQVWAKHQSSLLKSIKRGMRLRTRAAKLGMYDKQMRERLALIRDADVVLLNPAGELNPASIDPPLRMLLELRVAQKLGAQTAIVNHSVEVRDPTLQKIVGEVYQRLDGVEVRDVRSRDCLVEWGVPSDRVDVVPDMAFLAEPTPQPRGTELCEHYGIEPGSIGLTVNGIVPSAKIDEWSALAKRLLDLERPVVFVSNEITADSDFATELAKRCDVKVVLDQLDYQDYAAMLSGFELMVSSRLHTAILAMASGVPSALVEPSFFKIAGTASLIDYPFPVTTTDQHDWQDSVFEQVRHMLANRERYHETALQISQDQKDRVQEQMTHFLALEQPLAV